MHVIDQRGGPLCQPGAAVRCMGDTDRQLSPALRLRLCQPGVRLIQGWGVSLDLIPRPPDVLTSAALDMPAGLRGWHVKDVCNLTGKVLVPLRPNIYCACARRAFLDESAAPSRAEPGAQRLPLRGCGPQARAVAAEKMHERVGCLGLPVVGYLRDAQSHIHLAAHHLTLFNMAASGVAKDAQSARGHF